MRRRLELAQRDQLLLESIAPHATAVDEHIRVAFDQPLQLLVPVQIPDHHVIDEEQRAGADDAARHAVVVSDDRVLHGVRDREEHDQIERIELRQLSLAGQPQPDDQENIHHDGAQDFFGDR